MIDWLYHLFPPWVIFQVTVVLMAFISYLHLLIINFICSSFSSWRKHSWHGVHLLPPCHFIYISVLKDRDRKKEKNWIKYFINHIKSLCKFNNWCPYSWANALLQIVTDSILSTENQHRSIERTLELGKRKLALVSPIIVIICIALSFHLTSLSLVILWTCPNRSSLESNEIDSVKGFAVFV